LAETSVLTQQYYIATRSSPADERPRVLKYGKLFAVFDHYGDIGVGEHSEKGLFYNGTRFLSKWVFQMWDERPLLLSSTVKTDNSLFTADLSNVDVSHDDQVEIHRGTLHVLRSRFLCEDVCFEKFKISNFGACAVTIPLTLEFDADFADIFEVRGMRREERGQRIAARIHEGNVMLAYEGLDGALRQTSIEFEPRGAEMQNSRLYHEITLDRAEHMELQVRIRCITPEKTRAIHYDKALEIVTRELHRSEEMIPVISSPNSRFTDWMKRSSADVHTMIVGNPEEHYPYGGIPWFSTVFGRDGIITAMEMLWASPWIAKGVLHFLAENQATELRPEIEAEPGKILHEMRGGEMAALKEVPFGKYYGSIDSTPLFIMLAGAYFDRTGDLDFMRHLWSHVRLALRWMDEYGDCDGDGFIEYAQHSSHGLVQQGWKDSNDSVFHADGTLANAPIALCEVQGYAYAAKLAAARIAHSLGDHEISQRLHAEAEALQARFDQAFWCDDLGVYALALDGNKRPCRVRTSNSGQCLFTGIAPRPVAATMVHELLRPHFFNGWGIRTVAAGEARYNPLSYHNGSVWPHDNALIASGMARYGFKELAGEIMLALLDVSATVDLRRLPELFCGLDRRTGEGPTLYPVACSPQAWAAASGFLLVQACLGLSVHDGEKKIIFDQPYLPEGIPQLLIKDLRSADASVDIQLERNQNSVSLRVLRKQGKVEIVMK
jgi:glycogen debranching enzyme